MEEYHHLLTGVTLTGLTLDQKIGQMVMAQAFGRFRSSDAYEYKLLENLVTAYQVTGFKVYHGYCLGTAMLISHLNAKAPIPLLIASDLEMGLGQQIVDAPRFPPIASLGAAGDTGLANRAGYSIAQEALRLGINQIFAPLLDLHTKDDKYFGLRSIGNQTELVSKIGSEFIKGVSRAGAISTAKYFPGNGDQVFCKDGSTIVNKNRQRLRRREWLPFQSAIMAGVDAIMVSHSAYPFLDDTKWDSDAGTKPAALSQSIVKNILRDELGFEGLIVSDALNLPFLRKHNVRDIAFHACVAGCDLLVALTTPQDAIDAIKGVYDALDQGMISETQIDQSVQRILNVKSKIKRDLFLGGQALDQYSYAIGTDETIKIIEEIAKHSITLLRKPETGFPILNRPASLTCLVIGQCKVLEQIQADPWQPWHKFQPIRNVTTQWMQVDPLKEDTLDMFLSDTDQPILIVLLQWDEKTRKKLDSYLNMIDEKNIRVILALPISPNDAKSLSHRAWVSIWLPDFYQASRQALLSVIFGECMPTGHLD